MMHLDARAFIAQYGSGTISRYRSHSIVYAQGDIADSVFYIQRGEVKLSVISEQGKEAIVAILEAGDLCGEGCLNGQPLRLSTVTTISECIIARLEKATVIRALQENQSFSDYFIHYLLTQNLRLKEHLIDHLFNSSEKRLARALLLLANFGKEEQEKRTLPKIDQETLANLIGTTRGRVNHFMNKFRKLGFIEYHGSDICVHSSLLNLVLHDPPHGVSALRTNESRAASREGEHRARRDTRC
jgi:CRP-like cAMP-binding protein